jgi:hypothetical protein
MILRSIIEKSPGKRHWQSPENALREPGFLDFRVAGLRGSGLRVFTGNPLELLVFRFWPLSTEDRVPWVQRAASGPFRIESHLTDPLFPVTLSLSVLCLSLPVSLSLSISLCGSLEQKDEEEEMKKKEERKKKNRREKKRGKRGGELLRE